MKIRSMLLLPILLSLALAACGGTAPEELSVTNATVFFVNDADYEICNIRIADSEDETIFENIIDGGKWINPGKNQQVRLPVGQAVNVYIEGCDGDGSEWVKGLMIPAQGLSYHVGGGN